MKYWLTLFFLGVHLFALAQIKIDAKLRIDSRRQLHFLNTIRGDVFTGKVTRIDSGYVLFRYNSAVTSKFKFNEVEIVGIVVRPKRRKVQKPIASNLSEDILISPTAFTIAKGEFAYSNQALIFNNVNYGIREHLTIGAGAYPIPGLLFGWVNIKAGIKISDNLLAATGGYVGAGLINARNADENNNSVGRVMFPFSAVTWGSPKRFLNLSLGKILFDEDGDANWSPWLFSVGGSIQSSLKTRSFIEFGNKIPFSKSLYFNVGLKFIGKRSSTTFGATHIMGVSLPIFGYTRIL